jgi:lysophospholipase L1-like esterase
MRPLCVPAALALFLAAAATARSAAPFTLADGDRVVLVGNTLIEREQRDGFWETALTRRFPKASIAFRNLGWSGDTVRGLARAAFDPPAVGFARLKDHVLALKPTVIVVGYGSNESFDGPAGLPHFVEGLNALLDALAPAKARVVLLSPLRQEDLGRPLPDPAANNKNLRLYADAIRDTATRRGLVFVDLYDLLGAKREAAADREAPAAPLTDNGIHLTPWGYWNAAPLLEQGLGLPEAEWRVQLRAKPEGAAGRAAGARVEDVRQLDERTPLRFQVTDEVLPLPPPPRDGAPAANAKRKAPTVRLLRVQQLPPGKYSLFIDGKEIIAASAEAWADGVNLDRGPEFEQAQRLRRAIVAKNALYFHRWRPQNETYLFGFRRGEQGKNAVEIPQFDPLVAREEAEIARLRAPVTHTYEWKVSPR